MYNTINTKADHYGRGFFTVGSGPQKILLLGSCRVLPYLNYFDHLNGDNQFTVHLVNVVNFNFDQEDKPQNTSISSDRLEQTADFLNMVGSIDVFLHEHTENYGVCNTSRKCEKNIYKLGMTPAFDVALPNFNNVHVLAQEQVNYDNEFRARVKADVEKCGKVDDQWITVFRERGMARIEYFYLLCKLSGLPEFSELFKRDWTQRRYFWTGSHISNVFTMEVFKLINSKFLGLDLAESFWDYARGHDLYAEPHTPITYIDVMAYGLKWPQPVQELKL